MTSSNQPSNLHDKIGPIAAIVGLMASIFTILQAIFPSGLTPPIAALAVGILSAAALVWSGKWGWQTAALTLAGTGLVLLFVHLIVSQPATVIGYVIKADGTPISGLSLVLTNSNGVDQRSVTDNEGRFEIRNVPDGRYTIMTNTRLLYTGAVPSGWQRIFNPSVNAGSLPVDVVSVPSVTPSPTLTPIVTAVASSTSTSTFTAVPTMTPTLRSTSTFTPTPTPAFLEQMIISSLSDSGVTYIAPRSGSYTFEYVKGAYSIYRLSEQPTECKPACFSNSILAYLGTEGVWIADKTSLNEEKALFRLGDNRNYGTAQEAETAAKRMRPLQIRLYTGEIITILANDRDNSYSDNYGEVSLSVFFTPEDMHEVTILVPAKASWVNTNVILHPGEIFAITSQGTARSCNVCPPDTYYGKWVSPAGLTDNCDDCVLPGVPEMALIARVGTGKAFVVGNGGRFIAASDGELFLSVNDKNETSSDNEGSYQASIAVEELQ